MPLVIAEGLFRATSGIKTEHRVYNASQNDPNYYGCIFLSCRAIALVSN